MGDIEPYVDPFAEYNQWAVTVNPFVIFVRFVKVQHNVWYCFSYIMYRKAGKMLEDIVKPIQDNIASMFNMIEAAKQRVLSIPKMIIEAVASFFRNIVDGFKQLLTNIADIVMCPINIFVCTIETITETVSYPFRMGFVGISSATKWLWSFVSSDNNQEPNQQNTWGRRCLRDCVQATEPIRTRANNAMETVQEVCHDMPNASVSGGFRVVWWMLVWLVTTSMLGVWRAGIQKIANLKKRFFDGKEKAERTYNNIHQYAEDLFGSVYVNVVKLHGEAKIFVESYSQIPANILVLIIRDRIRTHCRFNNVRQWLRDNAAINLILEDNVRRTVSRHTLSSDGSAADINVHRAGSVNMRARSHGCRRRR